MSQDENGDIPTVSVRGNAAVTARPDEAVVVITVSRLDKTPERALADAARRSGEIEAILGELGVAEAAIGTRGLSVAPQIEYDGKARRNVQRGYRATNELSVTLADPQVTGRLFQEIAGRAEADVAGPFWRIAPGNPARAEAQGLAAEDARRKAEAYANALGVRLGPIVRVLEPGVSGPPGPRAPVAPQAAPAPAAPVDVHSGNLEVTASVEVTFAIEEA